MRKTFDLCIHLAHLALLLTTATLDGWRERRPARGGLDSVARDLASGARGLPGAPGVNFTMPFWQADTRVRYAMLVARPQALEDDVSPSPDSASCVNPSVRFAASQ